MIEYKITKYESIHETSWIRCRVLSFLDSAFYDDVRREKEIYKNPAIELIAMTGNQVIGFIDTEYEIKPNTVCSKNTKLESHLAGMIWHLGVHPDYRKLGIAENMLKKTIELAQEKGLKRLEAWTRDDKFVNDWYEKNGFKFEGEYVQWYFDSRYDDENILNEILARKDNRPKILQAYGHSSKMTTEISKLNRKYFCKRYDRLI